MSKQHQIKLKTIKTKDMSTYAKKRTKHKPKVKEHKTTPNPYYQQVMTKCIVSAIVCLSVLAISSIDTQVFNDATKGISYLINHEPNYEETFVFFGNMNDSIPTISDSNIQFAPPTTGAVLSDLLDSTDRVVGKLYSAPDSLCYCSCDGVVFFVDNVSADSPYIRVRHEDGFDTIYMGIVSSVDVGDTVHRDQIIGDSIGENIGFVLLKNSEYVDSSLYVDSIQ